MRDFTATNQIEILVIFIMNVFICMCMWVCYVCVNYLSSLFTNILSLLSLISSRGIKCVLVSFLWWVSCGKHYTPANASFVPFRRYDWICQHSIEYFICMNYIRTLCHTMNETVCQKFGQNFNWMERKRNNLETGRNRTVRIVNIT